VSPPFEGAPRIRVVARAGTFFREVGKSAFEKSLLGTRLGELERPRIRDACLVVPAESPQQLGACRVVIAVLVKVELLE
jgi:hypothetical protein